MKLFVCVAVLFSIIATQANADKFKMKCWDQLPDGNRLEIDGSYELYKGNYFADSDLIVKAPGINYSFYTRNISINSNLANFRLDSVETSSGGNKNTISLRHTEGEADDGDLKIVLQATPSSRSLKFKSSKVNCRFTNAQSQKDDKSVEVNTAKPKIFLPSEGMASYTVKRGLFLLCPENDKGNRCFAFADGDKPGRTVTNSQLYEAEGKFKGGRSGGAEDSSLEFVVLLNSIGRNTQRVRYQFADLAKGTTDGRYEGLICMGKAVEEKKGFPTWESCAYVVELRDQRTEK